MFRFFGFAILFLSCSLHAQTTDELVKSIDVEIKKILRNEDESNKLNKLKKALLELREINQKNFATSEAEKQIALCNYLIEQACILEALDGSGVGIVRKELVENINDHGLTSENKRYLRRLVELCEEAERSYSNVNFVEVDGSDAKADLLVSNVGAGVGISLALGDVTPLIASAVRIGRGYTNINKTKSRQLQTLIQSHKARITNFLFSVNSFKNDLIAEKGVKRKQIITPDAYRTFLKVLMIEDYVKKLKSLEELHIKFPEFKSVQYYLAEDYLRVSKTDKAVQLFEGLIENRNPILHKDGFVGQSFTSLAKINFEQNSYEKCISLSTKALVENSLNAIALMYRSESFLKLKKYEESFDDALKATASSSEDPELAWNVCKVSSWFDNKQVEYFLRKALSKGYKDFQNIRTWPGMKDNLSDWGVKNLLASKISIVYVPGVFKDDVVLENKGFSILEKFNYKIDLRYFKKGKWHHVNFEGVDEIFEKGEKLEIKNKFSMPKDSRCSIKVVFSSVQNPLDEEVLFYYNFDGKKSNLADWQYEIKKAWESVMKSDSKNVLADLKKEILKANEKSFYQDPEGLSLLAFNEHKLGNKKEAVALQRKALSIMERTLAENVFKVASEPFRQALIKYSK